MTKAVCHVRTTGQVARQKAYSGNLGRLLRLGDRPRDDQTARECTNERSPIHHRITPEAIESPAILRPAGGLRRFGDRSEFRQTSNNDCYGVQGAIAADGRLQQFDGFDRAAAELPIAVV